MSTVPASEVTAILAAFSRLGVEPAGVADDSRQVRPGDLFVAYPGGLADGRHYIADAIARGARAVLWQSGDGFSWNEQWRVANVPGSALRRLCGPLAHAICGRPSERLALIAITGTNGKTTISQWIAAAHPRSCAIIGTLGAGFPGALKDTGLTTPEATVLTRYLAEFVAAGAQACALEASSIGIAEGRLDGARVDTAVFTNLTRDHLDYHGSLADYAAAKEELLRWPQLRLAVINIDDAFGNELAARSGAAKILRCTQEASLPHAEVRADRVEETIAGLRFDLCLPNGRTHVECGLLGRFNVANLLAVAAVLFDAGLAPAAIAQRLQALSAPPGRLEKVGSGDEAANEPLIVVDYAHTPDALKNALQALRPIARARGGALIAVFGCGGDRDRGKRPQMGAIADEFADRVVLTSDNPRSEAPAAIIAEIWAAAPNAEVIVDRAEAIAKTVASASASDVILLAGKGHEPYQEIAGVRRPFSDVTAARAALAARGGKKQ